MSKYIAFAICIVAGIGWLVGMNYIAYQSFKRRNIPSWKMFHPLAIFKLEGIDYLRILVLVFAVLTIIVLAGALSGNFQT